MISSELAIDLKHVAKIYRGRVHALQGIEMHVRRGEIFGLLGPNGAGKSTLVKIMMTVVRPTRAQGVVLGKPIGDKATLARVGYLPENHRFPRYLTGRQTLEFFGALAKVDRKTARRRAAELLETVRMTDWAAEKVGAYSKGMMQRIGLAQALMNDPELILLDEPTDGVDPVGRREILDVLGRLRELGKTVFINSHALGELETICDRVAILVKGQVARQGTIDALSVAKQRYEIELADEDSPAFRETVLAALTKAMAVQWKSAGGVSDESEFVGSAVRTISSGSQQMVSTADSMRVAKGQSILMRGILSNGPWIELDGAVIRVGTTAAADVQPIVDALRARGLIIRRVQPMRVSLEDLFLETVSAPSAARAATPGAALVAGGNGGGR